LLLDSSNNVLSLSFAILIREVVEEVLIITIIEYDKNGTPRIIVLFYHIMCYLPSS
jgi:high-affinity Fe2+/Pb2+ permease